MAGTPRTLRAMNDRAALDLLLEHGPLSRTRIGKLTGLSKPTASQLLARLEASGLVLATGTSEGRPGPNAQLYEVDPSAAYAAGLDVTPERVLAAVADITGRTVGSFELPTPGRRPAQPVVRQVTDALDGAVKAAGLARADVHRLVIGTPGAFDPGTGLLRYASHLPGWHTPTLLDELAAALPMPVEYENDVNLVAVAEQRLGAARGHEDFVLLWNEGGLGAALVLGGQAAPRLDRRRGRGGFPAGSRSAPGAAGDQSQQWRLSGARGLPGDPGPRPRARHGGHPVGAVRRGRRRPRRAGRHRGHRPRPSCSWRPTPPGWPPVSPPSSPSSTPNSSSSAVPRSPLGGDTLRALVQAELEELAASRPRLVVGAVHEHPVLRGALESALAATRDEVFDTSR